LGCDILAKNKISMKKNQMKVFGILLVAFLIVIGGLAYRTLVQGDELEQKAMEARTKTVDVEASRGDILDRNGNKLAVSISADSIAANPSEIIGSGEEDEIADYLSEVLVMDRNEIYEKITGNSSFVWIKRKTDHTVAQQIQEADLTGISVVEETQRYYPKNTLAANILGFAGVDNQGLEGIEYSYNDILSGVNGSISTEYDAKQNTIPQAIQEYEAPENGQNIYLTIDENIQYFAERELDAMMESEISPKACALIAMDPQTGEVLAMASRPTYDPNNYQESETEDRRNMLVTDTYEPGSTFKIITASAALDSGSVTTETRFYDPGYVTIGSRTLKCWRYYNPHGSQSFAEIIQNSCNPCFVNLMQAMENKKSGTFYDYIGEFGFGEITNVGLEGEAKGIVIDEDDATIQDLASMSIGQSIAVTPLQLVTAVSAVANGGELLQPQIIKEITDDDGNAVQSYEIKKVKQVISEETANTVCECLESVVAKGTGKNAYIEGFRVGGKSGTAQKAGENGGYMEGKYVASFIAVAPVDDPQIVMLAIVDEPQGALYQGGQVAAPMLRNVLDDTLRYLGVTPQVTDMVKEDIEAAEDNTISVPDLTNMSVDEAKKVLELLGLNGSFDSSTGYVTGQSPEAYSHVTSGSSVTCNVSSKKSENSLKVPDLTGLNVRESAEILKAMGLKMKSSGSGYAVTISPVPGTEVKPGEVISITFQQQSQETATEPN
jgi:stage V sporulation protein D (sporulation-specific penicillin-binding protein)